MKAALLLAWVLLWPVPTRADSMPPGPRLAPPATLTDIRDGRSFGAFVLGAATGFLAHEAGHVLANLAYGNVPRLEGLWAFGFVPFFSISPRIQCDDRSCTTYDGERFWGGPRGKFVITSAGYNVQHLTDEFLLTRSPDLRAQRAPYRKGLLAFNLLLSFGYALASFTQVEDPHGDLTRSATLIGMRHEVYATALIMPALLDLYRYLVPHSTWAPWAARGTKGAFFGLVFAAPR